MQSPAPAGDSAQEQFQWLILAAASLRTPPTPEQAAALAQRYDRDGPGPYHRMGRFLLGYAGNEVLQQLATPGKRACEVSYYAGFKAEQRGDVATACDWYRASVENGTPRDGEYRWATERLATWSHALRSMARLEEEARRRRP